jgi:thioredoxin-related protein
MEIYFQKFLAQRSVVYPIIVGICLLFANPVLGQDSKIDWHSMQKAQQMAREKAKKVLVFADASWCTYCKKMKKEVFPEQAVVDSMNAYFYAVRVDIESDKSMIFDGEEMTQRQFAQSTGTQATPTFFFMGQNGEKLGAQPGFIPAETFSRLLGFIGSDAFEDMEFKAYLKQHTMK